MSVRRSAGVIFWGLILVTIGVLMLAHNLGYPIPIWPYVARYWPALLIAWGLLKFVDYFRFRRSGDNRPLFSGGEVALLILVIFAGSAITTAANVSPNLDSISSFHCRIIDGGHATTTSRTRRRSKSSLAINPASIVLPRPTSSAMNRLTRGSRSAFLSGSSWYASMRIPARYGA